MQYYEHFFLGDMLHDIFYPFEPQKQISMPNLFDEDLS